MLSYQHMYHAGNLADIHKHTVLAVLLTAMKAKDKPVSYMETHAGRGLYNLFSEEAIKTGEAKLGIIDCLKHKRHLLNKDYLGAVEKVQKILGKEFYPGSLMLARILLRDEDELNLMELHPQEYDALHHIMFDFKNVHTHKRDGYEGVLALAPRRPPNPSRGFVLIDPSYEVKEEYDKVVNFIAKLHKKWETAVVMLWYPILKERYHKDMIARLTDMGFPKTYRNEVTFPSLKNMEGIKGSGVFVLNMPFGAEEKLDNMRALFA